MKILILHDHVAPDAPADAQDLLEQVGAVRGALLQHGHGVRSIACTLNLASLERDLSVDRPDVVFNLVETLGSRGRLCPLVPLLLESLFCGDVHHGEQVDGEASDARSEPADGGLDRTRSVACACADARGRGRCVPKIIDVDRQERVGARLDRA
jgi:hypothetical protein